MIGSHLLKIVRLDTELGHYNVMGKTNKLVKLNKAGKDPNKLSGYRYLQVPQFSAQFSDCIWVSNLTKHLVKHNMISDIQHGFRSDFSCSTAVSHIFENINHSKGATKLLIYIDIVMIIKIF